MRAGAERVVMGTGRRFRLLCVPFAGGSARSFSRLAGYLGKEWSVVGGQPPAGFGGERATLDNLAHFYLGLLAEDLKGPGLLLGHSLGAAVVHRMARIRGERWPSDLHLVLSAPPRPGATTEELLRLDDRGLLADATGRGMFPNLQISEEFAIRRLLPDFKGDLAVLRDRGWNPGPVDAPVHLLGGAQDPFWSPADFGVLARTLQAATVRTVTGGHLSVAEQPEATAEALREIAAAVQERALVPN